MVITLDIETRSVVEGKVDPLKDKLVVLGLLEESGRKTFYKPNELYRAKLLLRRSKEPIVGHNLLGFDIPVLERYGFDFSSVVVIDTYDILKAKRRAKAMMDADLDAAGGHGLANCCKFFNLNVRKIEDFDYSVLSKESLFPVDWEYILEYLGRDLEASRALYDYLVSVFIGLKSFMNDKDQETYKWLTTSPGVCAYKVICRQADLPEEYGDGEHVDYPGAYVLEPTALEAHGRIRSFDYKSLYPHCMMMLNVFERTNNPHDRIERIGAFVPKGSYSKTTFGRLSQALQRMFKLKDQYEREGNKSGRLAVKIVINTWYGVLGNPAFKSVFDPVAAGDVTQLGQYFVRRAIKDFGSVGLNVLYGDTDSVYLEDSFGDDKALEFLAEVISRGLNGLAAFPQDTFELALENRISDIYFFPDGKGGFKKKFYVYVTEDGDMTVKGLPIKKRDRCALSKLVFERLKPEILEQRRIRFPKDYVLSLVKHNFASAELAGRVLFVKPLSEYKSGSSLQAQASARWGHGRYTIVPIVKGEYGGLEIGKGKMYLRIQDFKKLGLPLSSVRLDHVYKDLSYFIAEVNE
jgi:hypothetical protein